MRLKQTNKEGSYTASLSDSLTFADIGVFRNLLEDVKTSLCTKCIFDLSDLTSIDSAGLGMILLALDVSKKHSWSLQVTGAQGSVKQLMKLSRLDQLLAA